MIQPYFQDQIWKSGCSDIHELNADAALDQVIAQRAISDRAVVHLVDALPPGLMQHEIVVTDNALTYRSDYWQLWPCFYGVYYWPMEYQLNLPTKLFSCFINRSDPFRQSWMYQLVRHNLLAQGNVNYNLDLERAQELLGIDFVDPQQVFEYHYTRGNELFNVEHELLKPLVPYCSFDTEMEPAVIDGKIQLVLETYFDNHTISLSEKTFRAIQLPRPWLLFAASGAVAHLDCCGFDVFDDVVDHSYDSVLEPALRQMAILTELQRWNSIQFTQSLQQRFVQGLEHNQQLLKTLRQKWPERLQNTINYLYTV